MTDSSRLLRSGCTPESLWKSFTPGDQPVFMDLDQPRFLKHLIGSKDLGGISASILIPKEMIKKIVPVDLSISTGPIWVEWFNVGTGEFVVIGTANGGDIQNFGVPFNGDAILYLGTDK